MSFAVLRRHALASAFTAAATLVPLAASAGTAHAVPTAAETSVETSVVSESSGNARAKTATLAKKANQNPRAYARHLVKTKYGWGERQFRCLNALWGRESSWRVRAAGAGGSYGIPQATPGYKMGKGWRTSARTQINWGLSYIDGRHGSPCGANNHSHRVGWY
jgi:hypothetical protein